MSCNRVSYMELCSNNKIIINRPDTEFVGCIFCKKKYLNRIEVFYLDTDAACKECHIDTIVAWQLIPGNTDEDKIQQLEDWYIEGFTYD